MVNGYFKLMGFKLVHVSIKAYKGTKINDYSILKKIWIFLFLIVILSHKYAMN